MKERARNMKRREGKMYEKSFYRADDKKKENLSRVVAFTMAKTLWIKRKERVRRNAKASAKFDKERENSKNEGFERPTRQNEEE